MSNDDPFTKPASKGQPPYWLRDWDNELAAKHLRIIKKIGDSHGKQGPVTLIDEGHSKGPIAATQPKDKGTQ